LYDNRIADISPLAGLANLEDLDLAWNEISDISPLAGLGNLEYLDLDENEISDISPLAGLANLEDLDLSWNEISDISPLAGLANLTWLRLDENQIAEIAALSQMRNLRMLCLHGNPLNRAAYCLYLPLIGTNNRSLEDLFYDSDPDPLTGDCDGNCRVEFADFAVFASCWLQGAWLWLDCTAADLDRTGRVEMNDLSLLGHQWLRTSYERIYFFGLDEDPGWAAEGQWAFGRPSGQGAVYFGNPDPNSGYTGANVYGVNLDGDYDATVAAGPYYLTAGPFDCTGYHNVHLRFRRWLNADFGDYVRVEVEVSNSGSNWQSLWQNPDGLETTDEQWQLVGYDISQTADGQPAVYIRWSYRILDRRAWPYSGWNIDDIELWGSP